jgi:hypothetical protein
MSDDMVRLEFNLDPTEWHQAAVERLWARKLPTDDGTLALELQNSPFHALGVSYLDIVRAIETDGNLVFDAVLLAGGHSTYRLLLDWPSPTFEAAWARLDRHGCTYESGDLWGRKVFAVDVPPDADIEAVYWELEIGDVQGFWDFEEGHCGHKI